MANAIIYNLDVLSTSPEEINGIASRLTQLSSELLDWVAKRENSDEIKRDFTDLFSFEPVRKLFYSDESGNKARLFARGIHRFTGIVDSHIFEISAEFPNAVFLLEYDDMMTSDSGKRVIRAGEIVQEIFDGEKQSQAQDWVLLDIFAPFVAEWNEGLPFGSLWAKWVEDAKKQLDKLGRASSQEVVSAT